MIISSKKRKQERLEGDYTTEKFNFFLQLFWELHKHNKIDYVKNTYGVNFSHKQNYNMLPTLY